MKTTFASLKLKINEDAVPVNIGDNTMAVKQYLPIEDKMSIVNLALQNSEKSDGTYDVFALDMYTDLYIVYSYTDITFTEKQKENEYKLYDILESNGVVDAVKGVIPEKELCAIMTAIEQTKYNNMNYKNTMASIVKTFITDMPENAVKAKEIIENFDPEQFQNVLNFAKAANGNRDINNNQ